ncbi:uncharacterized protein LOC142226079 [Haematobia irritans]|uniref:uncharacterized protein LOC142226079 n=1 Tax=Haematobia irritans TaxID=7368 RepID=UPI003F4FE4FB
MTTLSYGQQIGFRLPLSSPYGRSNYDALNNLSGSNCGLLLSNRNSQLNDVSKEGDSRKVTTANDNEVHLDFRRGDAMAKLLISGLMADCTFIVGPENETAEVIPGHKVFFILVSEVFEEMFTGNFKEAGKNSEIRITDVEPRDFKNFRYIIYRNDCTLFDTLLIEDIIQIYMLSDKYLAHSIKKSCVDYLKRLLPKMSVENLILMFQFTRSLEEQILLDQVKNVSTY